MGMRMFIDAPLSHREYLLGVTHDTHIVLERVNAMKIEEWKEGPIMDHYLRNFAHPEEAKRIINEHFEMDVDYALWKMREICFPEAERWRVYELYGYGKPNSAAYKLLQMWEAEKSEEIDLEQGIGTVSGKQHIYEYLEAAGIQMNQDMFDGIDALQFS